MATWYEQTESMMKTWAEMQQQMMNNWTSLAAPAQNMTRMSEFWRDMTMQGIRAWTENSDPVIQDVAEKLFSSQNAMVRLLELSMKTWESLLPKIEGDWQTALHEQMERVRKELMVSATESMNTTRSMTELWQTYLAETQNFFAPWANAMQDSMKYVGDAAGGDYKSLLEMTSLYRDAYQETFGKLLKAPGLGYTREMDEKVRHSFAAWLDFQQAGFEYQVIIAEMWVKSFERLMQEMVELSKSGQQVESVRDFLNRWSTIADTTFKDAFRSPEYIQAQGNLINRMMEFRKQQRQVSEMMLQFYDMPTRTEIDEAHRRIYELRKEVKSLKRELNALKSSAPKKSTSRRKSSEE